jgi:hypothetical protein
MRTRRKRWANGPRSPLSISRLQSRTAPSHESITAFSDELHNVKRKAESCGQSCG